MKKILITGANSYIGTSFKKWISQYPDKYSVDTLSLRDKGWKEKSFNKYDVVLHTVGIAHVDSNPSPKMKSIYYKVNRDLTMETAKKAKNDSVKQFIFLSSIIVYGTSSLTNKTRLIDENTVPIPDNFYGNSKLQAEKGIKLLESDDFRIVIIRPPMIYGKGSKGNYPRLAKVARKLPIFPDFDNERSMLHIDNLCEFIRFMVDNEEKGLFFPQNKEYVKTSKMVQVISQAHNKNIILTKIFNPLIVLSKNIKIVNKVFGDLAYKKSLSNYRLDYQVRDFKESIILTEK